MEMLIRKVKTLSKTIWEVLKAGIKDQPQCVAHIKIKDVKTGKAELAIYVVNLSQTDALAMINTITGQVLNNQPKPEIAAK